MQLDRLINKLLPADVFRPYLACRSMFLLLVDIIVLQNVDLHATFIGKIYFTSVNIIKFDKVPLMCIPNFAVHYTAHHTPI